MLCQSLQCTPWDSLCGHLNLYMTPLFCSLVSLSLDAMSSVFTVFEPLKVYLYAILVACPFKHLTQSLYIWNHYGKVLVAGPIVVLFVV